MSAPSQANGANSAPQANGAPAEVPTRITRALSGDSAPDRAEPERPSGPRQVPGRPAVRRQARSGPAAAAAPAPSVPSEDPEATTQHAPVPASPDRSAEQTTVARPARPEPENPDATVVAAPVDPGADYADYDDFDEDHDDAADAGELERTEVDNAEIREIDATLARFSAVHDQIAEEEAARRKKFGWLLGKKAEPELGKDMPFDFAERDAGASRMDWKKEQRKRRTTRILSALAVAAALTIFVAAGIGWSAKTWVDAKFQDVAALDPDSKSIKDIGKQTGDLNFLLVGSDTRAGATPEDGVGSVQDEPGARADTTMIAHIPADRSGVQVVSFPRDLQVDRPACERWNPDTGRYTGEVVPAQQGVRLNEAYAVGGPKCTTKVVQQLSGLSVTNFLGVDFQGFKSMVDAVHGVGICSPTPIIDDKLGVVLPQAGPQTLSGEQALNYVRARHVQGDPTSDYGRMQRQQMFLSALLRKTMSGQVLLDPKKLSGFVDAVAANTFGENVSTDQLLSLGQSLRGLDAGKVTFTTIPTTGYANDEGMEVLRPDAAAALFQSIIDGRPAPVQQAQPEAGGAAQGGAGPAATAPAAASGSSGPLPAMAPQQQIVNAGTDICGG